MSSLTHKLAALSQEKAKLAQEEALYKQQRCAEIAYLAERCGLLAIPNEQLARAFTEIALNHRFPTR